MKRHTNLVWLLLSAPVALVPGIMNALAAIPLPTPPPNIVEERSLQISQPWLMADDTTQIRLYEMMTEWFIYAQEHSSTYEDMLLFGGMAGRWMSLRSSLLSESEMPDLTYHHLSSKIWNALLRMEEDPCRLFVSQAYGRFKWLAASIPSNAGADGYASRWEWLYLNCEEQVRQ